ncbi:hypothetical protein HDU92_002235 [Lobulomyces angularis]|nr:hypothetical protein HDU92_002235 [Lobulomyces angularis]
MVVIFVITLVFYSHFIPQQQNLNPTITVIEYQWLPKILQDTKNSLVKAEQKIQNFNTGKLLNVSLTALIPQTHDFKNDSTFVKVPDNKYFYEANWDNHLDARWGLKNLTHEKIKISLTETLKAFSKFSNKQGLKFWICHGTLLSWYWNKKIFPWDFDIDIQISWEDLNLISKHNQTFLEDRFFIDVNPWSKFRYHQQHNVIDARIIDKTTGCYIDITVIAKTKLSSGLIHDKSNPPHYYEFEELFPLHETELEGVKVWRPNFAILSLANEYGVTSFEQDYFNKYKFIPEYQEWVYIG